LEALGVLDDVFVFHAGTKMADDFVTNGGRVLGITALGQDIKEAQDKAYKAIENISFAKMHFRRDIGSKALSR